MSNSNIESLALYGALLQEAESSLEYWKAQPLEAIDRAKQITNFSELITSHKNNIIRLDAQIEDKAAAKSDLQKFIDRLRVMIEVLKSFVDETVIIWLTKILNAAEKLLIELK